MYNTQKISESIGSFAGNKNETKHQAVLHPKHLLGFFKFLSVDSQPRGYTVQKKSAINGCWGSLSLLFPRGQVFRSKGRIESLKGGSFLTGRLLFLPATSSLPWRKHSREKSASNLLNMTKWEQKQLSICNPPWRKKMYPTIYKKDVR